MLKAPTRPQQRQERSVTRRLSRNREAQIVTHACGTQDVLLRYAQRRCDCSFGPPRGCCRECKDAGDAQLPAKHAPKVIIRRPEVVRPLRDAMALIHAGEREACVGWQSVGKLHETPTEQALGRDEQHLQLAISERFKRGRRPLWRLATVQNGPRQ